MAKKQHHRSTAPGFQPISNPDLARAMAELRRSSTTSRHTPAPRKGTRRQRERQAIRDQQKDD